MDWFAHDSGARRHTHLHHPALDGADCDANQCHQRYDWNISIGQVSPLAGGKEGDLFTAGYV